MIKKIKKWFGQHTDSTWSNVINENTKYVNNYIEQIGIEGNATSLTGYILTLDQCNRALEAVSGRSDKKFIRKNHIIEDIKMRCPNYPKSVDNFVEGKKEDITLEYKKDDSKIDFTLNFANNLNLFLEFGLKNSPQELVIYTKDDLDEITCITTEMKSSHFIKVYGGTLYVGLKDGAGGFEKLK